MVSRTAGALLLLLVLVAAPGECQQSCAATCPAPAGSYAFQPADHTTDQYLYLAGLFGVHAAGGSGQECGNVRTAGVQNLEAFMWAVSTFHQRHSAALPGVSLGALGLDSCGSSDRLIQQVMNLETCQLGYGSPAVVDPDRVLGFVGPDDNTQATALAPLFHSREKTLVSHAASSEEQSRGPQEDFLLRAVPADAEQVHAILRIINKFGWKYVQTVTTSTAYGSRIQQDFEQLARASGICILHTAVIPENPSPAQMDDIVNELRVNTNTRPIVVLAESGIRELLEATSRRNIQWFQWIATSAWGNRQDIVAGLENVAQGAITLIPDDAVEGSKEFAEYLAKLNSSTSDPWFQEYQQSTGSQGSVEVDLYVPYTILAVDAILNGVEEARQAECGTGMSLCSRFMNSPAKWALIHDRILQGNNPLSFNLTTGHALSGKFAVYNFRRPHGNCAGHCYTKVGVYDRLADDVDFLTTDVYFYDEDGVLVSSDKVVSECRSSPCRECGETPGTLAPQPSSTDPVTDLVPTKDPGPPHRLREGTWVIVLIVLAGIGILLVLLFEAYILVKLWGTETFNHWKSMWLGQLLLLAIFLAYLTLFAFVPSPTTASCGIIRFGVGGSYAMCFSILLVKLMIILSSERVGNLQGTYQFFMFLFAWGVQVAVDIEWLILAKPRAHEDSSVENGWVCDMAFKDHLQSLVYVMFLILICTLLSIKAHGLMANHRESIFIGLSAGFTIPIWLVWTLIGSLKDDPEYHDPCLAFGLFATATLLLLLMFLPKVRQLSRGVEGLYEEDLVDAVPSVLYPGSVLNSAPPGSIVAGSVLHTKPEPLILTPTDLTAEPESVILVPNGGVYTEPDVRAAPAPHDPNALYLRHPGSPSNTLKPASVRSMPIDRAPPPVSIYATNPRVLHVSKDLTGRPGSSGPAPNHHTQSELNYNVYYGPSKGTARSVTAVSTRSGTLKKARSIHDLGSL